MPGRASSLSAAEAATLLTRCEREPGFAERLAVAYSGRHEVLDALAWRATPLAVSPSGRPDPASAVAPLKAKAYSRDAGPLVAASTGERVPESRLRLHELERELARDAEALVAAVRAVAEEERLEQEQQEEVRRENEHTAVAESLAETSASRPAVAARIRSLVRRPLAWAIVAAVIAACWGGGTVIAAANAPDPEAGIGIFDRPAGELDAAPAQFSHRGFTESQQAILVDPHTTRYLGSAYGWKAWAAKSTTGLICLLTSGSVQAEWTCEKTHVFQEVGLQLTLDRNDIHDADIPEGEFLRGNVRLSWGPDRKFRAKPEDLTDATLSSG